MTEVRFATVGELASLLRDRRISSVELAAATLELLETVGRRCRAIASLTTERALDEARLVDASLDGPNAGSPLRGIPYGAKDIIAARGARTTWGAEPFAHQMFDDDAVVISRLRDAGGVLVAKLASIALAGGGGYHRYANASLQGATRNPWDETRWSGGSSSGPAAAVAAGLLPYSLGSETSGSIGTPSAFCGITGLRPTYGLVDRRGAMTLSWSMDKIGPMARSSEDCGVVLETLSAGEFRCWDAPTATERIQGLRIGYLRNEVETHAKPAALARIEAGVRELGHCLGIEVLQATLPELPYAAMAATIHGAEGASVFEDLIHSPSFDTLSDESQKAGFRAALEIPAIDYLRAQRLRTPLISEFRTLFARYDVLLSFGQARTAPPIGERREDPDWWNAGLVPAGNLAGLPAIFFPCGFGADHMPVGLQVVGPPRSEQLLVAVVDAYQRETEHNKLRPA